MINEIVQNLIAVNRIAEGQNLSFEDALSIVTIYDELPEPNNLIDEAEELAVSNIDDLEILAIAIEEESERFLDLGLPLLKNIDFRAIARNYPRPYYDRFLEANKELNIYWKEYCQLNNRLDYLDFDSPEYQEAEIKCEEAKAEHDERQKVVRKLYTEYEQANKDSAPVFRFRANFLEAVIIRYRDIAIAILTDIKRIREGGS